MPEEPAMQAARSAVWRGAINQRLADGEGARALDLFEQAKGTLVPADQRALEVPMEAARTEAAADQWIAREAGKDGEPLATRLQADTGLSPTEKATALAKIEARDSAEESARITAIVLTRVDGDARRGRRGQRSPDRLRPDGHVDRSRHRQTGRGVGVRDGAVGDRHGSPAGSLPGIVVEIGGPVAA